MKDKPIQPNKLAGFFHGIDPATQNDWYTDIIHLLTRKPHRIAGKTGAEYKWIPFMVGAMRMRKQDPNDMMDFQIKMFNKFPPTFITIDATREEFLSSAITRRYGESRVKALKFSNSGTSNTKFQLKQIGYSYIESGYEWPDTTVLERTQPKLAQIVRILQREMLHEQVKYTDNGRVTFTHPVGKHNDMVHGWEMSLYSVMEFQKKNLGFVKTQITTPGEKKARDIDDEIESRVNVPVYDQVMPNSAFAFKG
jgi:hypothetical protein